MLSFLLENKIFFHIKNPLILLIFEFSLGARECCTSMKIKKKRNKIYFKMCQSKRARLLMNSISICMCLFKLFLKARIITGAH